MTDTTAIRNTLIESFNQEELNALCFKHFHPVYELFLPDMSKRQKVTLLLDYYERRNDLFTVIEAIQQERSDLFAETTRDVVQPSMMQQLGPLFDVPELPQHFQPRSEDLTVLKLVLLSYVKKIAITGTTWRAGAESIGGIGKSVMASVLAQDEDVRRAFPDGILWLKIGKEPKIPTLQSRIAKIFGDDKEVYQDEQEANFRLKTLLKNRVCLLILDDVWFAQHVKTLDTLGLQGRMIITTRSASLAQEVGAAEHRLYVLDDPHALRLLAQWTGITTKKLPEEAYRLTRECGNVPLAIAMIGALSRNNMFRWNSILQRLRNADVVKLGRKFPDYPYPNLLQTIHVSVESLEPDLQQRYFSFAVFPRDTLIPEQVIQTFWQGDGIDSEHTKRILDKLLSRALLQLDEHERLSMHDLQFDYLCRQVKNIKSLHNSLISAYQKIIPSSGNDHEYQDSGCAWHTLPPDDIYIWQYLCYHLVRAERYDELQTLLLNFDWIQNKLNKTDICALIEDYNEFYHSTQGMCIINDDTHMIAPIVRPQNLIKDALSKSISALAKDKTQLITQLLGRLGRIEMPEIQTMLAYAAKKATPPWLRLLHPSLIQPDQPLLHTIDSGDVIVDLAVTADGSRVVTVSDLSLLVWDIESQYIITTLDDHRDRVWAVAMTPDGTLAISASADHTLKVWNVPNRKMLATLTGHEAGVRDVAITPDGKRAVSGSEDGTVNVWDISTRQLIMSLKGHSDQVRAVDITADGQTAISGSDDTTLKVWDVRSGHVQQNLEGHHDWVRAVAITPDGKWAISGSEDRTLKLWDVKHGLAIASLEGHSKEILDVAITPDGLLAVSASTDNTLKVWDLKHRVLLQTLEGHRASVNSVVLTANGRNAVSASFDGIMLVWNIMCDRTYLRSDDVSHDVLTIIFCPDGRYAISGSYDATLSIWDVPSGNILTTLEGHTDSVLALAITTDGQRVVSASADATLKVWDVSSGALLATMTGHTEPVLAVAIKEDQQVISISSDHSMNIWDLASGQLLESITCCQDEIRDVALSTDGQRAVIVSANQMLHIWDLRQRCLINSFESGSSVILATALSHNGKQAIMASTSNIMTIWDLDTTQILATLEDHGNHIMDVALTVDGQMMLSASTDRTLTVWDMAKKKPLAKFTAEAPLRACCATEDGKIIAVGEETGLVHFLRLEM